MGACCTKFGSYLLRKEESKVLSNGGTPKLINKLEHKQSFVVSHTTYEEKPTAENILPSPDEKIDLSPQHHEDKLQPNKEDEDSNSKENSETEVKIVTGAAVKGVIRSNSKSSSSSSSSSSDNDSLENGTTSKNDQTVCQESDIKQDLAEIPRSLTQDVVETNKLTETPTPENKEVVESTESVNDPEIETKSISSKNSSSSESEDENNIPKTVEPEGEVASIKSDKESNSSRKSSTSETEINDEPESEKKASQLSSESPVPEITVTEYTTDEPELEKLPSEESSKSTSSSSSSESEEEPIDEAPHELPDHNTHNKTEDQEVESSEPEDKRDLTNGESVETPYVAETENSKISEKADSESESSSSSSDDHDEEDNEEEIVHTQAAENLSKAEVQKSYAQLITPSGFNPGAGLEVANDNVPEEANESDHDLM